MANVDKMQIRLGFDITKDLYKCTPVLHNPLRFVRRQSLCGQFETNVFIIFFFFL